MGNTKKKSGSRTRKLKFATQFGSNSLAVNQALLFAHKRGPDDSVKSPFLLPSGSSGLRWGQRELPRVPRCHALRSLPCPSAESSSYRPSFRNSLAKIIMLLPEPSVSCLFLLLADASHHHHHHPIAASALLQLGRRSYVFVRRLTGAASPGRTALWPPLPWYAAPSRVRQGIASLGSDSRL